MSKMKLMFSVLLATTIGLSSTGLAGEKTMVQPEITPQGASLLEWISSRKSTALSELAALDNEGEWLNSPALTASTLKGKVVLVDFWTYTCINWLRTLPYLREWDKKYRNQGLVVIGVHAPEFPFERDPTNVRRAVKEMGIEYPVVLDNDEAVWRGFSNQLWPTLYFIDAQGKVRYQHAGERSYEGLEKTIQELLAEAGNTKIDSDPAPVSGTGVEAAADWSNLKSSENYVGYQRTRGFASPDGAALDKPRAYEMPTRLRLNEWALSGDWTMKQQDASLNEPGGGISYRFHARDLHLVMGPSTPGSSVKFRVLIDGHPPGAAHGLDVDEQGQGTITEQRLYQLVRQPTPIIDRDFEIQFLGAGADVFCFTFG
ncbi:thioredoxin family protein [Mesorhizobium erdmanii]|uniref:thioredoxin family protein n=1 Tax=Mesorhizobium erdmanii TaxID=1777866 RepID=UPI000425371A|nr:thioredoxin family protein [Mesorhizobium erdmanii]